MKVSDIMQKQVEYVSTKDTIRDVSRLIFGHGINGVPVCRGKKVVGFVTERDILDEFYPSMQEYIEDPVHAGDFEAMEKNVSEILALSVEKIMSKNPTTVTAEMPLLRAQSLMALRKVGRLPVIDSKGNLIGILSKGDIFQTIIGQKLPLEEEEGFYDWQARHYDLLMDWKKRLSSEIPDLNKLFKKEAVRRVVDIASSTGEHLIELAKNGYEIFGFDASSLMQKIAEKKIKKLGSDARNRITLMRGYYRDIIKKIPGNFDAAIFMGNALSHVITTDKNILEDINKILNPQKSILVFQIINFDKIFKVKGGLQRFTLRETGLAYEEKHAFVGFYSKDKSKTVTYTHAIFDFDGNNWAFKGMNSTSIMRIGKKEITNILKKLGFSKISFYGGKFNGPLFVETFKPLESDWLNVVARR